MLIITADKLSSGTNIDDLKKSKCAKIAEF